MRHHGGVSPKRHGKVLHGETSIKRAAAGKAGKFPNFVYNGGPVVSNPRITASFWGASWENDTAQQNAAARLEQYLQDLAASEFMNVLAQYGVGAANYAGANTLASVASQLDNAGVQSAIQSAIDAGTISEPPANNTSDVLIVFLDESIEINDTANGLVLCEPKGDTAFGYHDFFTTTAGNPFYYAIIPALDDTCIQESCPGGDSTCSLSINESQEQRRTLVTSHEFAEMTTDPQLNAWYDPQNGENGDICNGETDTITVGSNTWTVQRTYSKYDDEQTNGATYCLATAPSPVPKPA
jgi:hypothetical protein